MVAVVARRGEEEEEEGRGPVEAFFASKKIPGPGDEFD